MDAQKILILMRGLPGSGKSTLAKKLAGPEGAVYSTDDFFMVKGQYKYDSSKIVDYHKKNFERTVQALKKGVTTIVIDNTNIKLWQMRKYVQQGQKFGYKVEVKQADSPWAFNYKQCAKKNTHEVPEQTVKKMLDNYQTFNNIDQIKQATDKRKKKY